MNVAVHDVTPAHWAEVEFLLERLKVWGVRHGTLLVVPRYRGGYDLRSAPGVTRRLRRLEESGWETVLHGLEHVEPAGRAGGPWPRLVAGVYTAGEGEFYRLHRDEALSRLRDGLAVLQEAGLHPAGFEAPAWLTSREARQALRDSSLEALSFVAGLTHVEQLRPESRRVWAPAISLTARSAARIGVSRAWARVAPVALGHARWVRVAIHPADARVPSLVEALGCLIGHLLASRSLVSYEEGLALAGRGSIPVSAASAEGVRDR